MFEFLQIVMYIPNPIMIAAKVANGTKRKKFVLRPINKIKTLPIKLSQYHSIKIVNMPKV